VPLKRELIWHVSGTLVGSSCEIGRKNRKFWKLLVSVEGGYLTIYVRADELLPVAASLEAGDVLEASGTLKPHTDISNAARPLFVDNPSVLRKLPSDS